LPTRTRGIDADLVLQHMALEPLLPVTRRYNVQVRGGVLSADGHLEYTAEGETEATLKTLTIEHVRVDYVHTSDTTVKETQVGHAVVKTAKQLQNMPETLIRIDHGNITNSEFGFTLARLRRAYRNIYTGIHFSI
jgi:hypothetical protein